MRITTPLASLLAAGLFTTACGGPPEKSGDKKVAKADKKADKKTDKKADKKTDKKADDKAEKKADAKAKTPEQEKAERLAKNKERLAKFETAAAEEAKRFDDTLKAEIKNLLEAKHKDLGSAITAAMAGKHRKPGNSDRDQYRHPAETLAFFGLKPDASVVEFGGAGWYTEILAPVLAKSGKLAVTSGDPNGPLEDGSTVYAKRSQLFLSKSPELYGKVETRIRKGDAPPELGAAGTVDLVLATREMHGWHEDGALAKNVAAVFAALKPGGVFGVVQHRAKEGDDPKAAADKGRLPEAWLIKQVEAAGFKLEAKSDVNANPKDTKDHPEGVWTLPPSLALKDKDKAKYTAIGESDRMTLKFVKPPG
ncbi:MAG: class I SAM-dependent methyltransferase [Myxococcales bacterium FL481]|nr:MAG: class I SAM-dependent methyltransferase [Myxococcales bacterium FL481]